ncbi:cytochrome c oxidase subunit II [Streptomyces carpinensis]|uniref:Cytochrome aa3 subunit 2 n=1 Tax=Streptomyces carpinensis TaxID=66369 RepID=A0ABV1W4K4_9ACTN|nr:cytochrome c oxidase subunit II [Streptomyces carpinensis]
MIQRRVFGTVFTLESAVAAFVFLVVLALVCHAVVRRRAGRQPTPSDRPQRPVLEKYYVGVLAAFAAFLVAWTAWQNHEEHRPPNRTPVRVDVMGFQWCWKFGYPQSPAKVSVTGTCRGKDLPTLVVPTGRPVELRLTSNDVIHSLWVPDLRYKMDAFPDHVNTFTLTLDHEGRWRGRCAEFCGERHYAMDFWIKAVSPEEYDRYLHGQPIGTGTGTAT